MHWRDPEQRVQEALQGLIDAMGFAAGVEPGVRFGSTTTSSGMRIGGGLAFEPGTRPYVTVELVRGAEGDDKKIWDLITKACEPYGYVPLGWPRVGVMILELTVH
jgi:hypothetical protein